MKKIAVYYSMLEGLFFKSHPESHYFNHHIRLSFSQPLIDALINQLIFHDGHFFSHGRAKLVPKRSQLIVQFRGASKFA